MRKLIIEFTKPVNRKFSILSPVIRVVQGTPYSHVRFSWTHVKLNCQPEKLVFEASGSKVKVLGTLAQLSHQVKVIKSYEIDLTEEEYTKLISFTITYVGVNYGILQLIGIGLALLFKLAKNPFTKGPYSQICSELLYTGMKYIKGWELALDPDLAGPREIELSLNKLIAAKESTIREVK